jgi:hypothetical protein
VLAARSSQLSAAAASSAAGVTCCLPASLLPHPAHNSAILPPAWLPTPCGCLLLSPIALCAGKAAKEAGSSSPENQFIRGIIALHDKYMEYVQVGGWVGGGGCVGVGEQDPEPGCRPLIVCLCLPQKVTADCCRCQPLQPPTLCPDLLPPPCPAAAMRAGLVWQLEPVPQGAEGGIRVLLQQAGARAPAAAASDAAVMQGAGGGLHQEHQAPRKMCALLLAF